MALFDEIQKILDSVGVQGAIHKLFDDIGQLRKDIEELRNQVGGAIVKPAPAFGAAPSVSDPPPPIIAPGRKEK